MSDDKSIKKKKGKRTTAELKAMAERYRTPMNLQKFKEYLHTNRFVHTPPEARSVDHLSVVEGNPGSDELLHGDGSYVWQGGKGLHPDYYQGG